MKKYLFRSASLLLVCSVLAAIAAQPPDKTILEQRKKAQKLYNDGNSKEALELYQQLARSTETAKAMVGNDMNMAISCYQRINQIHEVDKFREEIIAVHADNWRLLQAAAENYFNGQHYGYIVAGKFNRGYHRGGGRYVNSIERDRIRALQLMEQALPLIRDDQEARKESGFYATFARILMGQRGYAGAWRLQYLADLAELPDYDDAYYHAGGSDGAPVDEEGVPVYHQVPETYEAAATDGERWRWMLSERAKTGPYQKNAVRWEYSQFLHQQFGVQTMQRYGWWQRGSDKDSDEDESGTYALHTLDENETIAKLATGVKRFTMPEEADFIRTIKDVAASETSGYGETAVNQLASIFENRRQYGKAVEYWQQSIDKFGPGHDDYKKRKIEQIKDNWGVFEPIMTHPAGEKASVEYKFRNGDKVSFTAKRIDVKGLLKDVKNYLKSNPRKLDWQKVNIGSIGYRLVHENETKYILDTAAEWNLDLEPRGMHFDKRITVETPLKKAGAYLLTAKMKDGNTSRIIIWIDDTAIVRKQLDKAVYFFVGDAISGKPLEKMNVEFFGYDQEWVGRNKNTGRQHEVRTKQFAEYTDETGSVVLGKEDMDRNHQWLVIATEEDGESDRLAFLGFSRVWYNNYYDNEYKQTKRLLVTDRPVYRPDQAVKFKIWIRHARYDLEDESVYADKPMVVIIHDARGEKIVEKKYTTDEYGGLEGEYMLADDAALGTYRVSVWNNSVGTFRVEEYKKPEFEVIVDAPSEPVMLGDKITAKITAKYYFGAPVTKGKVKYKILRSSYSANWYPVSLWDWFYGCGYWWFAYDYAWYPGWRDWGCIAPHWWWWPQAHNPPEVIVEREVEVGADGTVEVEIDTLLAKEMHGDLDHRYEITAEVTDESRRTIVGQGAVLVARKPYKVYAWVDRGHYRVGDVVKAQFSAQTLDNKPVKGKGDLDLYRVTYRDGKPREKSVQDWKLDTDAQGRASVQIKASKPGQYRLSYKVKDSEGHEIEGGYVFVVRGKGFDGKRFKFNEIELVPDKKEYAAGDTVELMINRDRAGGSVVLFLRPANGVYLKPKVINLKGKSVVEEILVTKKDMPNFFVEAFTISGGKVYSQTREIIVPPEKRVLNVEVEPSKEVYKPGEKAKVRIKLTDFFGEPFVGSTVMSVYDKSVEYISGGSNVPEIREFFWKWRRRHSPSTTSSLDRWFSNLMRKGEVGMGSIGAFGHLSADEGAFLDSDGGDTVALGAVRGRAGGVPRPSAMMKSAVASDMAAAPMVEMEMKEEASSIPSSGAGGQAVQPTVRTKFADTAFWIATLDTDKEGRAEVEFDMPENLTGWKIRTWAVGHGTKVGEGTAEVVTSKDLMLRLQAPRFFVEKDEVVLSANIHNYLDSDKTVEARLELDGPCLEVIGDAKQTITVSAVGEQRVDWRVKVMKEGEAVIRMKALTDEESDAMEMRFPVYVHGMLKTESYSGSLRGEDSELVGTIEIEVPIERRTDQSRLELRYSPTLAGAMVDALPYLVSYPYGCTEQTLNRFLPTVMVQKILKDMGADLADIREKQTNLNAQEIGKDTERAKQWKRPSAGSGPAGWPQDPVFDEKEVERMVKEGLKRLTAMQLSDGGWGWFSGYDEHSYPHTTAYVVHGLITAKKNDVAVVPETINRGIAWLESYQAQELRRLKNAATKTRPYKHHADNLDAFVYMVLDEAGKEDSEMMEFIYRDRTKLSVYAKSMFGIALHRQGHTTERDMIIRNIEQYLVQDDENQTAYLNLPNGRYWWYWYGSEYEAQAYYLKLLAEVAPKSEKAARLVKYLLNNRKHATYWNSTRDTALCIEAMADYLRKSGEDKPDMTLEIYLDGEKMKEVEINADNLFSFDNKFILEGNAVKSGKHTIELRRKGRGPVYYNAYLTVFTLEDYIKKAGLEVKVQRKYYKLNKVEKSIKVAGSRGQALDQKVEKYEREELEDLAMLKSGDLIEIELEIDSKNDYEYLVFEDMKAAGFEPVDTRSGYIHEGLRAYRELRDEKVCFFVRQLARGKHSVSYRMRAEIPGKFSALPTKGYAMYAPELKANSDEIKLRIED